MFFKFLKGWVWRILQIRVWRNLQTQPFRKKKTKSPNNTHTQRLSLENSPNSTSECVRFPRTQIQKKQNLKTCFFPKTKMSLENSPNSSAEFGEFSKLRFKRVFSEFGEFSKLKSWVWRILQTQGLSLEIFSKLRIKRKNLWFFSKNAFGKFSKSSFKKSLENSPNSGAKSPNSFVPEKMNWRKKNKLRGSEVLKISNVQVQTHFLLKTMHTEKKTQRLRLSPVWVQKVVRVSREQNFATRKQLYSWESSREEFSNLCCQNLQAYVACKIVLLLFLQMEKTIKTVKTPQTLCLENTLNSSNSNKCVSLKTTVLTTKLHSYLSVQSSKSPNCVVVSKYVVGSGSGSVVFKFLCSKNSPTEKNQLRKHFRITSHK